MASLSGLFPASASVGVLYGKWVEMCVHMCVYMSKVSMMRYCCGMILFV